MMDQLGDRYDDDSFTEVNNNDLEQIARDYTDNRRSSKKGPSLSGIPGRLIM